MITAIEKIYGIGKYDHFDEPVSLSKNQIIFGFNGSGKSTLSDIFYSLSDEKHCEKLLERKTLQKDDGSYSEEPAVELKTDEGTLLFSNSTWNDKRNIYVFNDQYIADYVTVINGHDATAEQLVLGREGNKILRIKESSEVELVSLLTEISNVIMNHKAVCGWLGAGKTKIGTKTSRWQKKIEDISEIKLYAEHQRANVQKALDNMIAYNENIGVIQDWLSRILQHSRYLEIGAIAEIKSLKKTLIETPAVTNKEIANHISKYMSGTDINWLITGMNNLNGSSHCPFCGQELKSKSLEKLSKQLNRYIRGRQQQKANQISEKMRKVMPFFEEELMEEVFETLQYISGENDSKNLLHKKALNILEKMQIGSELEPGCFHDLNTKIKQKMENPYRTIQLSCEEEGYLRAVIQIIMKLQKFKAELEAELEKLSNRIAKTKEFEKAKALYEASFGMDADNFRSMINSAKRALIADEKIKQCQKGIDDLAEAQRIEGINRILEELNVNYRVSIKNNKFYIKIMGYMPAEYEKDNQVLCSEGERRMLAFAYFMQEIQNDTKEKIVVIDDPISSLDLSRKSVVAYKIVQLMENEKDQVIVLSHDISFVEKIKGLESSRFELPAYIEIRKNVEHPFRKLNILDYMITDKEVYEKIIKEAEESGDNNDRIIAFMAMRPFSYVVLNGKDSDSIYKNIENNSTYFHHSIYANSKRVKFDKSKYSAEGIKTYCNSVMDATGLIIDVEKLVPSDFQYQGLDYDGAWNLYDAIPVDSMLNLRKKALAFRILLETSLFMLLSKSKFDPEHIGRFYNNAVKGQTGEKKKICQEIYKMYNLSKKYHHGAEEASTLGLSALNPDEMIFFDNKIRCIHEWIVAHIDECNANASMYKIDTEGRDIA